MANNRQHPFVINVGGEIYQATYQIVDRTIVVSIPDLRKMMCAELDGISPLVIAKSLVIEMLKTNPDLPNTA